MDDRIKVVYSWIGPKGPLWNTELPNVMSLACASEHAEVQSPFFVADSSWTQMFRHSPEKFDMYPSFSITTDDERPFVIPYTLFWRVDFTLYFCGRTGLLEFAHVPWHLIKLVRDKNGYILIEHGAEAFMTDHQLSSMHGYFQGIHGLPLYKVIYMTGTANAKAIYDSFCERHGIPDDPHYRLTVVPYPGSAYIFRKSICSPEQEPEYNTEIVPEKLFLMWNRRFRPHRIEAACHLENLGLVEKSYISFSKAHIERPTETFLHYAINGQVAQTYSRYGITEETIRRFDSRLPLILDDEHEISQMCEDTGNRSRPYYQSSLVSIVTETNFTENEVTLTEKSFKPFKEKHPFILVAGVGALKELHNLGFKTFSEFWPETYDENMSPPERMGHIQEIFKIIGSWDHNQIIDFKRRVKPILEHNFQLLKSMSITDVADQIDTIVRKNIK